MKYAIEEKIKEYGVKETGALSQNSKSYEEKKKGLT